MFRLFCVVTVTLSAWSTLAQVSQERPPAAAGQVTFLYFSDLAKADAFYGETLGLEKEFDLEWVKIYNPTDQPVPLAGWYVGDVGPAGEYGRTLDSG